MDADEVVQVYLSEWQRALRCRFYKLVGFQRLKASWQKQNAKICAHHRNQ